jgi:hypothetical protein
MEHEQEENGGTLESIGCHADDLKLLDTQCTESVKIETGRLTLTLSMINYAIAHRVIGVGQTVDSVTRNLTDDDEVYEIIERVPPKSIFHKNPEEVRRFVDWLNYWKTEGHYGGQDSLFQIFNLLTARLAENTRFLASKP